MPRWCCPYLSQWCIRTIRVRNWRGCMYYQKTTKFVLSSSSQASMGTSSRKIMNKKPSTKGETNTNCNIFYLLYLLLLPFLYCCALTAFFPLCGFLAVFKSSQRSRQSCFFFLFYHSCPPIKVRGPISTF